MDPLFKAKLRKILSQETKSQGCVTSRGHLIGVCKAPGFTPSTAKVAAPLSRAVVKIKCYHLSPAWCLARTNCSINGGGFYMYLTFTQSTAGEGVRSAEDRVDTGTQTFQLHKQGSFKQRAGLWHGLSHCPVHSSEKWQEQRLPSSGLGDRAQPPIPRRSKQPYSNGARQEGPLRHKCKVPPVPHRVPQGFRLEPWQRLGREPPVRSPDTKCLSPVLHAVSSKSWLLRLGTDVSFPGE